MRARALMAFGMYKRHGVESRMCRDVIPRGNDPVAILVAILEALLFWDLENRFSHGEFEGSGMVCG